MTAALAPWRPITTVGGDPGAIRQGALVWCTQAAEWSLLADDLRAASPAGFVGDEADAYRAWLTDDWAVHLDRASEAWGLAGRALARYADDLDRVQQRLRALASEGNGGDDVDGGTAATDTTVDPWVGLAVERVLSEHAEAVTRCRAAIDAARALCPSTSSGPGALPGTTVALSSGTSRWRDLPRSRRGEDVQSRGRLTAVAGGLRTASGLSALAWSAAGLAPASGTLVRPADGDCGGAPPTAETAAPTMPSPTTPSQWPKVLGISPDASDPPTPGSTTSAPSAPPVTPAPTTAPAAPSAPPATGAPEAPATTAPTTSDTTTVAPSSPTSNSSVPPNGPVAAAQPCSGIAGGATWDDLPRSGPFPFEPKPGQSLDRPQSISRDKNGYPVDKYKQRWRWDRKKEEWDVQNDRTDTHTNVNRNGRITHGPNNTGRKPKPDQDSANSSNWLDDLLGGVFTVHLDPNNAAEIAALTAAAGVAVYIVGGILAGG